MAEDLAAGEFTMHGARAAMAGGLFHIEEQIKGIERAVVENPGLAFDLAKTLIESACRTILTERSIAFDPTDDLPRLFRTATNTLPFLPASASAEAEIRKSLVQTLSGLHTAVQGVCELRNACGFASHGAEGPRPALETVQALLVAETSDAIVGFLHRVHRQDRTPPAAARLKYEENGEFNAYVDEAHALVRVFEEDFEPSRVLFELAPEAYRLYLAEYVPQEDDGGLAPEDAIGTEPAP
jgi:Abortive infection C-terminus